MSLLSAYCNQFLFLLGDGGNINGAFEGCFDITGDEGQRTDFKKIVTQ